MNVTSLQIETCKEAVSGERPRPASTGDQERPSSATTSLSAVESITREQAPNRNILIAGASGTGKTQTNLALLHAELQARPDQKLLVLDNNDEHDSFIASHGGQAIDVAARGLPFNPFRCADDTDKEEYVEALLGNYQLSTGMGSLQIDHLRRFLLQAVQDDLSLQEVRESGEEMLDRSVQSWIRPTLALCKTAHDGSLFETSPYLSLKLNRLHNRQSRSAAGMFAIGEVYRRCAAGQLGLIRVVLEEAQLLRGMPWLERILREGRKFGIATTIITQTIGDLDPFVLANCGHWLVFQCDATSARRVAATIGATAADHASGRLVSQRPFEASHICCGRLHAVRGSVFAGTGQNANRDPGRRQPGPTQSARLTTTRANRNTARIRASSGAVDSGLPTSYLPLKLKKRDVGRLLERECPDAEWRLEPVYVPMISVRVRSSGQYLVFSPLSDEIVLSLEPWRTLSIEPLRSFEPYDLATFSSLRSTRRRGWLRRRNSVDLGGLADRQTMAVARLMARGMVDERGLITQDWREAPVFRVRLHCLSAPEDGIRMLTSGNVGYDYIQIGLDLIAVFWWLSLEAPQFVNVPFWWATAGGSHSFLLAGSSTRRCRLSARSAERLGMRLSHMAGPAARDAMPGS